MARCTKLATQPELCVSLALRFALQHAPCVTGWGPSLGSWMLISPWRIVRELTAELTMVHEPWGSLHAP